MSVPDSAEQGRRTVRGVLYQRQEHNVQGVRPYEEKTLHEASGSIIAPTQYEVYDSPASVPFLPVQHQYHCRSTLAQRQYQSAAAAHAVPRAHPQYQPRCHVPDGGDYNGGEAAQEDLERGVQELVGMVPREAFE
eukprot:3941593-Rhodomonas_salina.4